MGQDRAANKTDVDQVSTRLQWPRWRKPGRHPAKLTRESGHLAGVESELTLLHSQSVSLAPSSGFRFDRQDANDNPSYGIVASQGPSINLLTADTRLDYPFASGAAGTEQPCPSSLRFAGDSMRLATSTPHSSAFAWGSPSRAVTNVQTAPFDQHQHFGDQPYLLPNGCAMPLEMYCIDDLAELGTDGNTEPYGFPAMSTADNPATSARDPAWGPTGLPSSGHLYMTSEFAYQTLTGIDAEVANLSTPYSAYPAGSQSQWMGE